MSELENFPKIIYLDTYSFAGHMHVTRDGQRRVELSQYLKDYPELHERVLRHEIEHAKIGGVPNWRHLVFDIKDRFSWITDPTIWTQFQAFRKRARPRLNVKQALMFVAYTEIGTLAQMATVIVAGPIRMYRRRYKTS